MTALLLKLQKQHFNGYVEILASHEHGLLLFHQGRICNCFYEGTAELKLSREQIIRYFLPTTTKTSDTIIKTTELDPQRLEALSALAIKPPVQQELETVFLDMNKLFDTLCRKNFTGTLRFFQIRNNPRLGNLLLKMKKITAEQLREAIQLQLSGAGALRLGDALVKIKALSAGDLKEALTRQLYTRKSSDNELALALFFEGVFLGGYTSADKILTASRQEVLAWILADGVLLDIIEGVLPKEVSFPLELKPESELEPINPKTSRAEARPLSRKTEIKIPDRHRKEEKKIPKKAKAPEVQAPNQELQQLIAETLNLKGDDLILDFGLSADTIPSPPKPAGRNQERDASPRDILDEKFRSDEILPAAAVPTHYESLEPVERPETKDPFAGEDQDKKLDLEPLPDNLQGLEYMRALMEKYMGFLGRSLLKREQERLEMPYEIQSNAQLRIINKNLFLPLSLLVGPSMARRIVNEIQSRIGE
jgi:hypothetical protein